MQTGPGRFKKLAFGIAAGILPILLLGLLEGVVRSTGVNDATRAVFITIPGHPEHLALNPDFVARYFSDFVPGVAYTPFLEEPGEETFRVMVLGGSTTAGFPYGYHNAFPELLAERLSDGMFGRKVEVVNLGLTAVNSYTLRDLAPAVADHEPDAVIIYAGHNEYYGAMGTGSAEAGPFNSHWLKLVSLKLRRLALYTLLENWIVGPPEPTSASRTLMARAVRDATIEYRGPVYESGVDQFNRNLDALLAHLDDGGIPVFIGTLTSNLADQPPFSDDRTALASFAEGQRLLASGDTVRAREAFVSARVYDTIRFRGPDTLNTIIRSLNIRDGVHVVDIAKVFQQASPGGLESDAIFTDHLHPNEVGYNLMAEAFYQALMENAAHPQRLSPGVYGPADPVDRAHVELTLSRLKGDYPYNKVDDEEVVAQRFRELINDALAAGGVDSLAASLITGTLVFPIALQSAVRLAKSSGDSLATLQNYLALLQWQPFNEGLHQEAIAFGLSNPSLDGVTDRVASLAVRRFGSHYALSALATTRIRRGAPADGAVVLEHVLRNTPDDATALFNLARAQIMLGDTLSARATFDRYRAASTNR